MSRRAEKVSSLLQKNISEILQHELNDPVFKSVITITKINLGSDLKRAIVYFRVFEGDPEEVERALNRSKGYIKKLLAERISLKFMPDLEFKFDTLEEEERRLDELFKKLNISK